MFIIIAILSFITKVLGFFLVKLWLWVPLLFSIGYVVACFGLGIPLSAEPGRTIYIVGAILLTALCILGSTVLSARRSAKKREEKKAASEQIKRDKKSQKRYRDIDRGRDRSRDRERYIQPIKDDYQYAEYDEFTKYEREPRRRPERSPERVFSEEYSSDSYSGGFSTATKQKSIQEKPFVYATRKDPNILIMDYSDKLLIFRKCPHGGEPILIDEEIKG